MDVGYIRVSSIDQNTARQLEGLDLDKTFTDKASGKSSKRPQLKACLGFVRNGDVLHVHSIDRMARNLLDLQQIVNTLTAKGVTILFHKEHMTFSGGNSDPMAKLMFQVLGAFAEFERSLIRERQAEGIAAAKIAGKHLGRPVKLTPDLIKQIKARKTENKTALARELGISRASVYAAIASQRAL